MSQVPQLTELHSLKDTILASSSRVSDHMIAVRNDLGATNPLLSLHLPSLESAATDFITSALAQHGLVAQAELANTKVDALLKEIKFFGSKQALVTGYFSTGFSAADEQKWQQIEHLLDAFYNSHQGTLRQMQDFFLYQVSRAQIARLLNKEQINLEEELFVRSLLLKGYLANFRELLMPFYRIDEQLLIDFKQDRIKSLSAKVWQVGDHYQGRQLLAGDQLIGTFQDPDDAREVAFLTRKIDELKNQASQAFQHWKRSQEVLNKASEDLAAFNVGNNTGSVVAGTLGTGRYIASASGHAFNSAFLKNAGRIGGLFGRCLPFVSVAIDCVTQTNNNQIVFNYEKKLRFLSLIEASKRHLVVLEQQVIDYYIDSVLCRLQESLLGKQFAAYKVISDAYDRQLALGIPGNVERTVELVQREYYQNVNAVIAANDRKHETEIAKKDQFYQEIITAREEQLSQLDQEIVRLTNQIETKRKRWEREQLALQKESASLQEKIANSDHNLQFTRDLLAQEKKSHQANQAALKELAQGDYGVALQVAYNSLVEEKSSLQLILNKVIEQKNQLEAELGTLKPHLATSEQELVAQREEWEVLNERLTVQRDRYRREKEASEQQLKDLRDKYVEVSNKYTLMASREVILNAAKDELIIDKEREIKKCDDYRTRIELLSHRLQAEKEQTAAFLQLKIESREVAGQNSDLNARNKVLSQDNCQLRTEVAELQLALTQEKRKFTELDQKSYQQKIKLMTILAVDSARNFLPAQILSWNVNQAINSVEATLLVGELSNVGNDTSWFFLTLFVALIWLIGCWKFFAFCTRKIFRLFRRKHNDEQASMENSTSAPSPQDEHKAGDPQASSQQTASTFAEKINRLQAPKRLAGKK